MVKCIKKILCKFKLVINDLVNFRHTKVDKSKLVVKSNKFHTHAETHLTNKNPVNSSRTKLDKSRLVLNNPVNLGHTKLNKSKLVLNIPVNLCHLKLYCVTRYNMLQIG